MLIIFQHFHFFSCCIVGVSSGVLNSIMCLSSSLAVAWVSNTHHQPYLQYGVVIALLALSMVSSSVQSWTLKPPAESEVGPQLWPSGAECVRINLREALSMVRKLPEHLGHRGHQHLQHIREVDP